MKKNQYSAEMCALLILAVSPGLASCARTADSQSESTPQKAIATVPTSWILPEARLQAGETITQATAPETDEHDAEAALAPDVDRLFSVSRAAVEKASQGAQDADMSPSSHPADWVPWHMEFFTTDLSVTASGKIGVLTVAGSPSVQAFWRRQNEPAPQSGKPLPPAPAVDGDSAPAASLMISDASDCDDVSRQIETIARATMATGQVNDESKLRESLGSFSAQFEALAKALEAADQNASGAAGSEWWVSRLRVDLIVAASGTIGVAPATLGGNLRLRFEWQRLSPTSRVPAPASSDGASAPPALLGSMKDFVLGMKADLTTAAAGAYQESGLYPYQVRIGLGMTASGMVGVAKGSAELLGHVYFATNVTKPVVHASGKPASGSMALIEKAPDPSHLALADQSGVSHRPTLDGATPDGVVYQIAHEKFAAGLKKAIHMGAFFAKRAAEPTKSVWKPYQMYVGFDVSVTGTTGVVSLAGNSSDEIDFYNGNF